MASDVYLICIEIEMDIGYGVIGLDVCENSHSNIMIRYSKKILLMEL